MKKIIVFIMVIALLISGCSRSTFNPSNSPTDILPPDLTGAVKVALMPGNANDLGDYNNTRDYEKLIIDKQDAVNRLAGGVETYTPATEKNRSIKYHATFYFSAPEKKAIDIWFEQPNYIWAKGPDGRLVPWQVKGPFVDELRQYLPEIPEIFVGQLNVTAEGNSVFLSRNQLFFLDIDLAIAQKFRGAIVKIVGNSFTSGGRPVLKVRHVEEKPVAQISGTIKLYPTGDLAVETNDDTVILVVNEQEAPIIREAIGKKFTASGFLHPPNSRYAKKFMEVIIFRIMD